MSVTCPAGHTSQAEDYCDTCGAPIGAAAAPAPAPASPVEAEEESSAPRTCPNCDAPAAPKALFCESCGYDFTTGTAPQPVDPVDPFELPVPSAPADPPQPDPADPAAGGEGPDAEGASDPGEAAAGPEVAAGGSSLPTPATPGPDEWVAEVWIDPDWYQAQSPEDPMPSPGMPRVVALRSRSLLVGRPSASRHIRPDIDGADDNGISRRHCQLSTDGNRWWVEDLDSSNGTYVGGIGDPLPSTPLPPGERRELADGDQIYLGAWTKIVVRKALPGEV